jgi:hypothetical protein
MAGAALELRAEASMNIPNWSDTDEARDEIFAAGLGDGLPVVVPTRERIERMLTACSNPDATIAILPPGYEAVTWRDVAINAVMAGCDPPYLPVVAASIEAIAAPEFNLLGIATTTGSATMCIIVNGPAVRDLAMNAGVNAFGPGNRANATIGRAVRLTLQNAGGARSGETDMATLGQPGKYTFCFAENEAESPWVPLHVERGFERDASIVTTAGVSGTIEIVDSESMTGADLAQTYAQSMLIAGNVGSSGLLGGGEPLIVMPPEHADVFVRSGMGKREAKAAIYERARLSIDRLSPPLRARAEASAAADGELRVAAKPDDIMIVVAGGVGRKGAYVPTWSGGTRAVSRLVKS